MIAIQQLGGVTVLRRPRIPREPPVSLMVPGTTQDTLPIRILGPLIQIRSALARRGPVTGPAGEAV